MRFDKRQKPTDPRSSLNPKFKEIHAHIIIKPLKNKNNDRILETSQRKIIRCL